ncbi:MAG: hypothetical protein AAGH83_10220, partial [Pseudomonadota bacterium]
GYPGPLFIVGQYYESQAVAELISPILNIVAPVAAIAAIGLAIAFLKLPFDHRVIDTAALKIGFPCLIIYHLNQGHIEVAPFLHLVVAFLAMLGTFLVVTVVFLKLVRLPIRAFATPMSFINISSVGLPIVSLAYGPQGLSYGVAAFAALVLSLFTVGEWIPKGSVSFRDVLTSPVIYSIVIALALLTTDTKLPAPAASALQILGGLPIPLMLLTLGHSLATLKVGDLGQGTLLALFHLATGLSIGLVLASLFGFEGTQRGVYVVMSIMPVGIIGYLFVEKYTPEWTRPLAGVILVSNILTLVSLPLVLTYVL